jgi:ABC-type dipeptide/oligopeptide/nickel transport system ATPase component
MADTPSFPPSGSEPDTLLEVKELKTYFFTDDGVLPAVDGVTFSIARGHTLALVGESGCGKSVTSYSLLRLVQKPGKLVGGKILLHSQRAGTIDIASLGEKDERLFRVRGGLVSMIFQEPMTALSPVHTVGDQIGEAILLHQNLTPEEARQRTIDMLRKVGVSAPERRVDQYPHELSGGMRQRVVIAMALVCNPELLIADEPTTALDVTIQAQILALIKSLQREVGCSVLLITHDLGVVAQTADEVAVMYLGRIVESGTVRQVLKTPRHPYTLAVLKELGAADKQMITVFNKVDAADPAAITRAQQLAPDALLVSARSGAGLPQLVDRCLELIADTLNTTTLLVPHERYDVVARLHEVGHVQHEEQRDDGVYIQGRFPVSQSAVFTPFVVDR